MPDLIENQISAAKLAEQLLQDFDQFDLSGENKQVAQLNTQTKFLKSESLNLTAEAGQLQTSLEQQLREADQTKRKFSNLID